MRFIYILLFLLIIILPANAQIITGGIEYNTSSAREELLYSEKKAVPYELIKANIVDNNHNENVLTMLKGITELKDRTLAYFSDGSYGLIYRDNPDYVWYYSNNGKLTHSEVKTSQQYPYKTYKYTPQGDLVNMSLRVSKNETYIFTPTGKLIAHWLNENCYDENNKVIMTRKILE